MVRAVCTLVLVVVVWTIVVRTESCTWPLTVVVSVRVRKTVLEKVCTEVRVTLRRLEHEPILRGPGWAVEVADSGEGIDPLHLPRLTERFYRVDTHRSRAQGGTGLGLAIVKHIVNRHRGRLRIESTRGQGSRFTVLLPESLGRL